ncbi:peptidase inhibitor family I36 protein [Kribbella sp. NBC_01505]|uniref:hypothetical protein n=1 Tax=Kribbella sp. NBC_01505 TaxID=2903580 RepID=UPI003862E570
MRFMQKTATAAAVVAVALTGAILSAAPASAAVTAPPPDGNVYAWLNINAGEVYHCRWVGNDDNWTNCTDWNGVAHDMNDKASSVQNRGFSWAVNFYHDAGRRGAYACLSRGDYWPDLRNQRFTRGGGSGAGEVVNNQISSHMWVSSC